MEEIPKLFNKFANLMERDIRGVEIGCYSVALLSLTIAVRKVRPFSKFKSPKDIPNHFIKERRELSGLVKRIEPNEGLLMVEHKPLINIPIVPSRQLPLKISGVHVTGLGFSWLQAIVVGQNIIFIPIFKDKNFVKCEVLLAEKTKDSKEKLTNIGEHLVRIGFAKMEPIQPTLLEDPKVLVYYKRLRAAERYALRKKQGLKYYVKPTQDAVLLLFKQIKGLMKIFQKQVKTVAQLTPA
ncbi:uncharacterized protein LOC132696580 [Cylas formicarius]|uniref:uncharacterized protein LOC132696580 n=1 Tax=Cylas formicarius TaxID=197179 RepID=UPI00295899CC|nr:uncharacterized protein LOC132696580 [Cylas formicarius]XP_060517477.1 uncharacterized protein LOC132696580 [Cylas formicarius]XP_060517486.1 uncharacterized protein LOC132696580 [Cylas formicarius]